MWVGAWWLRLIVRTIIALLALWALAFAADRYDVFLRDFGTNFRFDTWLWLSWIGAAAGAGLLFGLAACLPFARVRFLPSRLLLAALALLPLAHFWWVFIEGHGSGGWLARATGSTGRRFNSYCLLLLESRSHQASGPKHPSNVDLQVHRRTLPHHAVLYGREDPAGGEG
jgi:hypothetical protein